LSVSSQAEAGRPSIRETGLPVMPFKPFELGKTSLQTGTDRSLSVDGWALNKNVLANRAPAISFSPGSAESEAIISRITLPARSTLSVATPHRCALPSR